MVLPPALGRHKQISIHSLTQRETILHLELKILISLLIFQSTPSRRGRRLEYELVIRRAAFQSTPSRRGRLYQHLRKCQNPYISIHSLTQRETLLYYYVSLFYNISIHSLTQRETQLTFVMMLDYLFQSTPSRRGRQK